jgi:hypothetical protein
MARRFKRFVAVMMARGGEEADFLPARLIYMGYGMPNCSQNRPKNGAQNNAISVHANITAQRKPISATAYEYVPHHNELGQLGKIFIDRLYFRLLQCDQLGAWSARRPVDRTTPHINLSHLQRSWLHYSDEHTFPRC